MKVWLSLLESLNEKAYLHEYEWSDNETLELDTDSAGSETMGGSGFFSIVGIFSVATELGRLGHFKGYYFP